MLYVGKLNSNKTKRKQKTKAPRRVNGTGRLWGLETRMPHGGGHAPPQHTKPSSQFLRRGRHVDGARPRPQVEAASPRGPASARRLPSTSPAPAAGAESGVAPGAAAMASRAPATRVGSAAGDPPERRRPRLPRAARPEVVAAAPTLPGSAAARPSRDARWAGPRRFVLIALVLKCQHVV